MKQLRSLLSGLTAIAVILALVLQLAPGALALQVAPGTFAPQAAPGALAPIGSGENLWRPVGGTPAPARPGAQPEIKAIRFETYTLNRNGLAALLATAPHENSPAASQNPLVLSLPNPFGKFQDFAVQESPIMEPGLAAKHPEIKTYRGRGIDDPTATLRFDLTPLGFHASVRSPQGAWYIDPYYHLDDSLYISYYGRDLKEDPHGTFVERDAEGAELSVDHGYYHAADTVTVFGSGFAANVAITIGISDPEENFATRTLSANSDELGAFEASFVADPDGNLDTHILEATDGIASAWSSYQVVRDDDPTVDPPTGDVLRTYRLALITDPGYATYFGGSANVTPAKVTLINRVDQLYEEDMSIRLVLIANNDLLNLDTWAQAIGPNGPCGAAGCFTQSQVTGCSSTSRARYVIGQIIGASNYDIGHLGLGQPGGGVAQLGVVGRSNKAGGCTGIPTPVGDFYAVDYVAHEMGHQFSGNHPFNGNQLNCSGGNRNASTSTEPGSGSSVMAYAGICLTDDLQAHSDPYFSQRSQQEISTYTSGTQAAINEVQTASLRHFGGGNETQVVTFGPGYAPAATIQPLSVAIGAVPSATQLGGAQENGNTVTISTGAAGSVHTLQVGDVVTITGVAVAGYNGTFTVTAVLGSRAFQYTNPITGLATSGGGTVTLAAPGATEIGNTVTIRTAAAHGRSVGDLVTIAGVGVVTYTGVVTITAVPSPRSFEYTNPAAGLVNSGGGSVTFFSPFQVRIGGNDSALIGGSGLLYSNANIQSAINGIVGFSGTVTVTGAASTGFTVAYGGASAGIDVPSIEIVNLSCGGCFASVEETNHGGASDSFTLNYDGNVSTPITNNVNYTAAAIQATLQGVSEVQTVLLVGYDTDGDAYTLNYAGADTVAITRGQNNTAAGIAAALQGGNEQQAITFANFNAANAGNSYQVMIGGNLSAMLGNGGTAISNASVAAAINAITGFTGTVSVSGASNTAGPTITFAGALANTDVPAVTIVFGACSGAGTPCTATNRENVKGTPPIAGWPVGGAVSVASLTDTGYTLTFGGTHQGTDVSLVTVTNGSGVTGSSVETTQGSAGILPVGATATVAGFGGGTFNNTGFQVTYGGVLATTNVSVTLALQDFSAGASGFVGETDKGGAVDNTGGTVTPTGNSWPTVTVPATVTIPLRTPFALTGSATDAENDPILYSWEQNDRGAAAGSSLLNNTKTDGPLFAMFPKSGQITLTLVYTSPGENNLTNIPTRVFPDLQQILDNNTNADTGACPAGPIAPPVPQNITECYAEFLPTASYVGFAGVNASPLSLHFRFTARDGRGGVNSADTTVLLTSGTGPFLVTSPNTAVTYAGGSAQTITWNPANTDLAPINATDVKISLSTDGGHTYPYVLVATTPNDGSELVTLPTVETTQARVKIEAVGNIFFDVSNADFTIAAASADVGISQTIMPGIVNPNSPITYTLTITNAGPSNSSIITVTDDLPATNFNFGNASGAGWSCTSLSGVVTCTLPDLAAGGLTTINITGTVTASTGTLTNTAWVTSSIDPAPGNNGPITLVTEITPLDQTITFASLPDKTYGDADFVITATASSGLPVSFDTSATDQCTNTGSTIHLTGAGACIITATQAGNGTYNPASPVSRTFTINPAATTVVLASTPNPAVALQPITFTATVTSVIGTPPGTVQLYADGALLSDPIALSSGSATLVTSTLTVGTHVITATYSGAANYVTSTGILTGGQVVDPVRLYLPVISR
jgi:hypothetical protein